jgi:hypothetical protein
MSPEQALGTGELDGRTDVYSLGSVVYEMLVGETPASWPGPEDVKLGRFSDLPIEHRSRLERFPGRVEQVLARALALRAPDRFPRAGELARALLAASEKTPSFSDEQVRQLLERAAELQAREPEEESALTMGAVEQVAAQVGIPPEHVRKAAQEMQKEERRHPVPVSAAPPLPSQGQWLKSPEEKWDRTVLTRSVEGEIPDEAFASLVAEIQARLGMVGHASVLAGTLTWSPAAQSEETRKVVVSVERRDGRTSIRVDERYEIRGFRKVFVGLGVASGVVAAAVVGAFLGVTSEAAPALLIPFAGLGVFTAIQGTIRFEANTRRPELEGLAARLAQLAEQEIRKEIGPGGG